MKNSKTLETIKKGSVMELENLLKLSNEKTLKEEDLNEISKQLNHKSTNSRKKELLWLIALKGIKNSDILKLAKNEIHSIKNFEEYPIISYELKFAICYALQKAENYETKKIADELLKSKSGEVRILVSEFYFQKKQTEKSIKIMIEILDEINIDHDVANAIDMDLAQFANIKILNKIKRKYINEKSTISDGVKHIISVMETAISKNNSTKEH